MLVFASCSKKYEEKLIGKWITPGLFFNDDGYYRSDTLIFSKDTSLSWKFTSTLYTDNNVFRPIFTFEEEGSFTIDGRTEESPDAQKLNMKVLKRFITVKTENDTDIHAYYLDKCNSKTNVKQDISLTGCSIFPPLSVSGMLYQPVQMDASDAILLGKRRYIDHIDKEELRPKKATQRFIKIFN
jgi:hypothetical protein